MKESVRAFATAGDGDAPHGLNISPSPIGTKHWLQLERDERSHCHGVSAVDARCALEAY